MFNGSNWDRKSQLSGILTEPLNPRDSYTHTFKQNLHVFICSLLNILVKFWQIVLHS